MWFSGLMGHMGSVYCAMGGRKRGGNGEKWVIVSPPNCSNFPLVFTLSRSFYQYLPPFPPHCPPLFPIFSLAPLFTVVPHLQRELEREVPSPEARCHSAVKSYRRTRKNMDGKIWHNFVVPHLAIPNFASAKIILPSARHLKEGRGTTIFGLPRLQNCLSRLCPSPFGTPPPPTTK